MCVCVSSARTTRNASKFRRVSIHAHTYTHTHRIREHVPSARTVALTCGTQVSADDASGTSTQRMGHLWIEPCRSPLATFPLCGVTCEEFRLWRKLSYASRPREREKTGARCTRVWLTRFSRHATRLPARARKCKLTAETCFHRSCLETLSVNLLTRNVGAFLLHIFLNKSQNNKFSSFRESSRFSKRLISGVRDTCNIYKKRRYDVCLIDIT